MKSPVVIANGAAGPSLWARVDYLQRPFVEGLFCSLSEDASGITYNVEHTPDNPDKLVPYTAVRAAAVLTLTFASNHGLVAGDSVQIYNSVLWNGNYTVASAPSPTTLTVAVANSGVTADVPQAVAALCRVFIDNNFNAKTTKQANANVVPVLATRINNTGWTGGTSYLEIVQGYGRG